MQMEPLNTNGIYIYINYILACLSIMFLGYLFRHCFAIFVPNFWDFLSLTFASLGNFLSLTFGIFFP